MTARTLQTLSHTNIFFKQSSFPKKKISNHLVKYTDDNRLSSNTEPSKSISRRRLAACYIMFPPSVTKTQTVCVLRMSIERGEHSPFKNPWDCPVLTCSRLLSDTHGPSHVSLTLAAPRSAGKPVPTQFKDVCPSRGSSLRTGGDHIINHWDRKTMTIVRNEIELVGQWRK